MASGPSESDPPDHSAGVIDDTVPAAMPLMEVLPERPSMRVPEAPAPERPSERYRMGAELGRGGMGRVVEAFDVQLGRTVALKEALPRGGHGTYRRFAREVQITARLEHASIVPLYDSGTTPDGRPFYVMRRVTGRPFDELIARARGLGERLALLPELLAAIDAIGHAHRRGVIHRDLKPANILVGELGETVVIDWGLAKVVGEEDISSDGDSRPPPSPADSLQTQVGSVFGTPGFMAPEQARGEELGPRGDVYALGATLYQLLSGSPPYGGKSATEVIDRNRKAEIRPIAEAAPEAPRELIAIVAKSLAADASDRYANAGALGEDVRRFLTGQLVAAHRYTRRQRVRRFARRHRAPLIVAALAAVAVAVLAWFSVHRVLSERALAVEGRTIAEERLQALVVARARALIEVNPTQALAALKSLPRGSPHEDEARALAQSALVRGVAWGFDEDDTQPNAILFPRLSPDGKRVAVFSQFGHITVYDAETHARIFERTYDRGTRVIWVESSTRLLVTPHGEPAFVLDPATGDTTVTPLGIVDDARASDHGDRIVFTTNARDVSLYDTTTKVVTPLWAGIPHIGETQIADDGSWIFISSETEVVVYDGTGHEIARKALPHVLDISESRSRKLALSSQNELWELDIDHLVWTQISTDLPPNQLVLQAVYRGDKLTILTSHGEIREWLGVGWVSRLQLDLIGSHLVPVGSDLLLASSANGHLHWLSSTGTGVIKLPSISVMVRVEGSRSSARMALSADRLILIYDLGTLSPLRLDGPVLSTFSFLDDDTVLFWTNTDAWTLYRTKTGQHVDIPVPWLGSAMLLDVLPEEGRALFQYLEQRTHLLEVRDDVKPIHHLAASPPTANSQIATYAARLLPGDGTVFAESNAIEGTIGDARPHEVARLDGDVVAIARLGRLRFGAVSARGELVRGSLESDVVERGHMAPSSLISASSMDGKMVIGAGTELLEWDTDVAPIAHFAQPIRWCFPVSGGLGVVLSDMRVVHVERDPASGEVHSTEILPRGSSEIDVADGGKIVIARANGDLLNVVELPSGVRWSVPVASMVGGMLSVAPTTRQVVQHGPDGLVTWRLPRIEGDLQAWLARATNAVEDSDGDLSWPTHATTAP